MPEHKKAELTRLRARCTALIQGVYASREKVVVFGEGNPNADIALVGEAPGEQETLQERPFVGKAGKNLDEFLKALGIAREDIWITNVVKFRPVKEHPRTGSLSNRPPTREEIELCFGFLVKELAIVAPKVVVTLGNVALRAVADDKKAVIGERHGRPEEVSKHGLKFWLFPLYHPASIIYNRELASTYEEDLRKLREWLVETGIIK
jgi:uracil-DNA glycosylase family 4